MLNFDEKNTFYICLDQRKEKFEDRLQRTGINATRISAVLPNNITDVFASNLTKNQCACAQSHINIYRMILNNNDIEYALILEDDVCFDKNWKNKLAQINDKIRDDPQWDLILLNCSESSEINTWSVAHNQYLTGSYIISRLGVTHLFQMFTKMFFASDFMTSRLQNLGHSYCYFPWLVIQEGIETTIGSNVVEDHKKVIRLLNGISYDLSNYII